MKLQTVVKYLIIKDIIVSWPFLIGISLMTPFLTSISLLAMMDDFGGVSIGFVTLITIIMCGASSILNIIIDTNTISENVLVSIPIKRSAFVLSRYLTSILNSSFTFGLILFILWLFSSNYNDEAFMILLSSKGICFMYLFILTIQYLFFPLLLGFGPVKGMLINMILAAVLLISKPIISLFDNLILGIFKIDFSIFKELFDQLILFLKSQSELSFYLTIAISFISIFFLSLNSSIYLYSKRDL